MFGKTIVLMWFNDGCTPHTPPQEVQDVEEVRTTFGPNLASKAPDFFFVNGGV